MVDTLTPECVQHRLGVTAIPGQRGTDLAVVIASDIGILLVPDTWRVGRAAAAGSA